MLSRLKNSLEVAVESLKLLRGLSTDTSFWHDRLDRKIDLLMARMSEPRLCTVLLLWDVPPTPAFENELGHVEPKPGWPGFASVTVAVPAGADGAHAKLMLQYEVPAGAWVIGFNCWLRRVFVGADLMDLGMPDHSPACRLSKRVQVGQYLNVSVSPCG